MRIIGALSWYEESPTWLAETVASVARLCDHIVAVDGPYSAFPGARRKPASGTDQADAILRTAAGCGIGATIHSPRQTWWGPDGGEVAKRNFMFQMAMTFAESGDWLFRIDADEVLTTVPADALERLTSADENVAELTIWQREVEMPANRVNSGDDYRSSFRCLYRAIPGVRIEQTHYTVTAPVGGERVTLSGLRQVPALDLWDMELEHRTHQRTSHRQELKRQYSEQINSFEKVEDGPRDD